MGATPYAGNPVWGIWGNAIWGLCSLGFSDFKRIAAHTPPTNASNEPHTAARADAPSAATSPKVYGPTPPSAAPRAQLAFRPSERASSNQYCRTVAPSNVFNHGACGRRASAGMSADVGGVSPVLWEG